MTENYAKKINPTTRREYKLLSPDEYLVVNKLSVPYGEEIRQIERIIISKYGIFVIETKSYKGQIQGEEEGYEWTQTFEKGKYEFYNPIRQSKNRMKALEILLKENFPKANIVFFPIIVFSEEEVDLSQVKTTTPVLHSQEVEEKIKSYREKILLAKETWEIYDFLSNFNIKEYARRKARKEEKKQEALQAQVIPQILHPRGTKRVYVEEKHTCPVCKGNGSLTWKESAEETGKAVAFAILFIVAWFFQNYSTDLTALLRVVMLLSGVKFLSYMYKPCPKCKGKGKVIEKKIIEEDF